MATNILTVHLATGHATAVAAVSTLRSVSLSGFVSTSIDDPAFGEIAYARRWDRVVASLPANAAFFRFLDLPFRDRRRLAQAVGPLLEEHVPLSLDDAATGFDLAGSGKSSATLAAMVRHVALDRCASELERVGLSPSVLVWQPLAAVAAFRAAVEIESPTLLVDVGIDCTVVAHVAKDALLGLRIVSTIDDTGFVRDLRWAVRTLEATTDRVILGGALFESAQERVREALDDARTELLPAQCPLSGSESAHGVWREMTTAVGLVLIAAGEADAPVFSFLPRDTTVGEASSIRASALRAIGPWLAASLVMFGAAGAVDYARLYRSASQLERTAERIFNSAMPGVSGGAGRRTKLELRLRELEEQQAQARGAPRRDGALGMLVSLSRALPPDLDVEFQTYAYDPPNVRMRGHGTSFETVTRLQQVLREAASFGSVDVGDVRSSAGGSGVDFELTIRLGEKS